MAAGDRRADRGDVPFESHDLSGLSPQERTAAIERVCTRLQGSFDLGQGLLLQGRALRLRPRWSRTGSSSRSITSPSTA